MPALTFFKASFKNPSEERLSLRALRMARGKRNDFLPLIVVRVVDEKRNDVLIDGFRCREVLLECAMDEVDAPFNGLSQQPASEQQVLVDEVCVSLDPRHRRQLSRNSFDYGFSGSIRLS